MKKQVIAITLTFVMFLALIPELAIYASAGAPSSWAVEEVKAAIDAGLVPEILQSSYTQPITRAEFCALAVALDEITDGSRGGPSTIPKFSDTDDVNVERMAWLGVVDGVGDNRFDPDGKLTREQAATILSRLAYALNKSFARKAATFNDVNSISPWALDAVGQMQMTGVMSGVGENIFLPKGDYTREQSILTILRTYKAVNSTNTSLTGTEANPITMVAAGRGFAVCLYHDGTVGVDGAPLELKDFDIASWQDIKQITASANEVIGLRKDGTVCYYSTYRDSDYLKPISAWFDIIQIDCSGSHVVGVKKDGTVVAVHDSNRTFGETDLEDWTNIKQVSVANSQTVGLRTDGTVLVAGITAEDSAETIARWSNIVQVAANGFYGPDFGLTSGGNVVSAPPSSVYEAVASWRNIVQLATRAEGEHGTLLGLTGDGNVLFAGTLSDECSDEISSWRDIVEIDIGSDLTILGLKSDGTLVSYGLYYYQ